jgi:hypothetical protein
MAIPLLRQQPFELRVFSPLQRIMGSASGAKSASLFAARGEFESFQIAVLPHEHDLKLLRVEATDLASRSEHVISKKNITLYREHIVAVRGPLLHEQGTNHSLGPGRYADPLIPLAAAGTPRLRALPVDLTSREPAVIWADIFVSRDTSPGSYEGSIHFTTNESTIDVPVFLTVWDFELPLTPSLKSSFAYWTSQADQGVEELLRHKLMPLRLEQKNPSFRETEEHLARQWGLKAIDASFWSGADQGHCAMQPAPSVQQLREARSRHSSEITLYNYTADEIVNCTNLNGSLTAWARNLHDAGLKNLVVMPPNKDLLDDGSGTGRSVADIWVVLPPLFDRFAEEIAQARSKGDEIWSYSALSQDSYSPKWLIDYEPINARVQAGFLSQSLRLKGLLYWRVDRWSSDPWNDVNNIGDFSSANFPGEGLLVYPGADVGISGVAPSIRLKQLRDGVEDYEYLEILKRLSNEENVLAWSRQVARDWKDWSQDPSVLENTRLRLGEEIQHRLRPAERGTQEKSVTPP